MHLVIFLSAKDTVNGDRDACAEIGNIYHGSGPQRNDYGKVRLKKMFKEGPEAY